MRRIFNDQKMLAYIILCSACIFYFFFLLAFYNTSYFVPDFRLYNSMALNNRKAADGFSSLFIWMASLCNIMPKFMTFASLAMMCLSVYNILFFYYNILWDNIHKFLLVLIVCMSCGVWYYFYGKVFYDIPFSVFTYSLCLLAFMKVYINKEDRKKSQTWWYILAYLIGLTLSWKPYNIFMISGAGLCFLLYADFRNEILVSLKGFKRIVLSVILILLGYSTGNFNIFVFPVETIEGIKAYPASYIFSNFMLDKHRIIWDHINDLPFSISVFSVFILIFAGILWPIMIKKIQYIFVSLFMFGALIIYISNFSPGYTWHGFSYGLYFIIYILVLIKETKNETLKRRGFVLFLSLSIIIQCSVNFGYYIPTQIRWAENTRKAIKILEDNESEIYIYVSEQIVQFGESTYMIDNAIKRFRPYHQSALELRTISIEQPYIVAENIVFVDPLQYMDYDGWNNLYARGNYLGDPEMCNYIIFIIPNIFKNMSDVANIHQYDNKNLINVIREKDYTIYVYSNL